MRRITLGTRIRNQLGFSIIEALIGVGIVAVVSMGLISVIQSQQKATSSISKNLEFNSIINEIEMYLAQAETCAPLFSNATIILPNPASVTYLPYSLSEAAKIRMPSLTYRNSRILEMNVVKNGLTATAIEFDRIIDNTLSPNGANPRYILNFTVTVSKTGDNYGSTTKTKSFPVLMEVDAATNRIANCSIASSNSDQSICTNLLGGTYDSSQSPPCVVPPKYQ